MPATPYELFANVAYGTLQTAVGTSDTTWTVLESGTFPTVPGTSVPAQFRFSDPAVPGEQMTCTSRVLVSGSTYTWTVTRAAEGSTAAAHAAGNVLRDTVTAGIMQSFQDFLTWGMQPYYQSVAITPSATINSYGTSVNITAPGGWRYLMPLHVFGQVTSIGTETLTVSVTGTLADSSGGTGLMTFTTASGQIDTANVLAATAGLSGNTAGQLVWWAGNTAADKRLATLTVKVKSSIGSSTGVASVSLWAIPLL